MTTCCLSGKLYSNISHDNGTSFTPLTEINPAYDPCDCCTTSAVYGADGKLAVLYREETNNERDMYVILWNQDRGQFTRTRISSPSWKINACPMSSFAISRNGDGYVADWPTKGEIYFARLDSNGKLLPPGQIKTPGKAGMHTGMLGLSAVNGLTLVAWKDNNELHWQLYGPDGRTKGLPDSAPSSGNGVAGVVSTEGRFVLFR